MPKIILSIWFIFFSVLLFAQDENANQKNNSIEADTTLNSFTLEEQELFDAAESFLRSSKSDKAIDVLHKLLDKVGPDSKMANKINISIAEGYRLRQEHEKGLSLL